MDGLRLLLDLCTKAVFYSQNKFHPLSINLLLFHLEIPPLVLLYIAVINIVGFLAIVLVSSGKFLLDKAFIDNYPDAFLIEKTIKIVEQLNKGGKLWLDIESRQSLMFLFESVARCIENQLYKKLDPNDAITNDWFRKVTKEIATAVRAKKALVLIPKENARQLLSTYFQEMLTAVGRGSWEELERIEPTQVSFKIVWHERIVNFIKTLITGGAPVLTLYLVQKTNLALNSPMLDYATAIAILWALFTLIVAFDPSFTLKIEALKGIAGLFPFGHKE